MLTGPELGAALRAAMELKDVSQVEVARHFVVKPPSVSDWLKHGRIGKQHIDNLMSYFSDVVPPEHWGFSGAGPKCRVDSDAILSPEARRLIGLIRAADGGGADWAPLLGLVEQIVALQAKAWPRRKPKLDAGLLVNGNS